MYIMPDPASRSQAFYMTNIQENKLHLIKSRFKQICLDFASPFSSATYETSNCNKFLVSTPVSKPDTHDLRHFG